MSSMTRRTFIATGSLAAAGLVLPPPSDAETVTGVWDALKTLHDGGTLGAVRRCHVQCLRADAPGMRDALEGLQQSLGMSIPEKISACGKYAVPNEQPTHFLINLEYDRGTHLIFTSASLTDSWGMIRGERADAELFADRIVVHVKNGSTIKLAVANAPLPRTQTSLTVLNLSLDALNQAVTIYPGK
jgi:hypothetical protein